MRTPTQHPSLWPQILQFITRAYNTQLLNILPLFCVPLSIIHNNYLMRLKVCNYTIAAYKKRKRHEWCILYLRTLHHNKLYILMEIKLLNQHTQTRAVAQAVNGILAYLSCMRGRLWLKSTRPSRENRAEKRSLCRRQTCTMADGGRPSRKRSGGGATACFSYFCRHCRRLAVLACVCGYCLCTYNKCFT